VDLMVERAHARAGTERQRTGKKEEDPEAALKDFRAIVTAEDEKGEWWVALFYQPHMLAN
jgi:hypothetical protein